MRALKFAMAFMGILIVVGVTVIAVTLFQRMNRMGGEAKLPSFGLTALGQAEGTEIRGMTADGGRLVLHVDGGGEERLLIVDLGSGKLVGTIAVGAR